MLLKEQPLLAKEYDELQIRHLLKEIVSAFNKSDVEQLLSFHSDDVILMDPGIPLIQGKKRIREMFAGFQKRQLAIQLNYDIHELEVDNNWAFVRGSVAKTSRIQSGIPLKEDYRFICLFKKQNNECWLRTHVIVNSNKPMVLNNDQPEVQLNKFYELYNDWDGTGREHIHHS